MSFVSRGEFLVGVPSVAVPLFVASGLLVG